MNRRDFGRIVGAATVLPLLNPLREVAAQDRRWSIRASLAECCSCGIPCPCNFGRPTDRGCFGNRLIRIHEGHFEGSDLAGISFLVTFAMGQWSRLYISDALTEGQYAAFERVLPVAFGAFDRLAQARERVPLEFAASGNTIRFSVPDSRVEMKVVEGLGGAPIRVTGLPNPAYHDYLQYESVVHTHRSESGEWSYTGTNGFTSEMRVSG